jgi:hypothetical protein
VLRTAKNRTGPNMANIVGYPISLLIFWPKKLPDSKHVMMEDPSIRPKVQIFFDKQPHVTLPTFTNNNAGSLFDLVQ